MNNAKRIAIVSKTVTGQYGSATVLQQVHVQSDQQSFLVYTLLYVGSWSTDSWGRGPKIAGALGIVRGFKISLSAIETPIRQKRPNFRIP